ncbi:ATP-binding protein [Deefgea rivuli]|uniref:ATP-binding protein n=1 Tax=Deefgea rivuli TaxID=400948 RepID=UPI000488E11A|nr:ATP-binding protein [Deefgea rivuli]
MDSNQLTPHLLQFITRAEALMEKIEAQLPAIPPATDWQAAAYRWRKQQHSGFLQTVRHPQALQLSDIQNVDRQKQVLLANTAQFVAGRLANNVLLTGARGTGKSSLIKAVWHEFRAADLRLIEVEKAHLVDLPDIVDLLSERPERFIIFCDDLSFEEGDYAYQALKTALDGSIASTSDNILIYATSNRRHLVPEYYSENAMAQARGGEIHAGEAVEEKISLSERFGLWLTLYSFDQNEYLNIAQHWLRQFGITDYDEHTERAALQWAQTRGARSGRIAWQFARDWAGKHAD